MTTYIFEYKAGRSFRSMTVLAGDMQMAMEYFDAKRPARSHLLRVVQA